MSETAYCSKTCQVRRWKGGLHGHKQEGRQKRVFDKMREASNARKHAEVVTQCVMGVGLLEQATALAVESGDDDSLMAGQNSLGNLYGQQGELEKAITQHEQARAIAVELGHRKHEGHASKNPGLSDFFIAA